MLLLVILAVGGSVLLFYKAARQWVAFAGSAGHRPSEPVMIAAILRRAGVRYRIKNVVSIGSEATMGAGMSTTVLVQRSDLAVARRAVAASGTGPASGTARFAGQRAR
jgi:hypothetical protein